MALDLRVPVDHAVLAVAEAVQLAGQLGDQLQPALSGVRDGERGIRHVGDCTWAPPEPPDPALASWLDRAASPVVYAQLGPEFGAAPIDDLLAEVAADLEIRVALDTARSARPRAYDTARVLARPHLRHAEILPNARAVVASAHPTAVLGAIRHGLPLVLLPDGSGTEDNAAACVAAGIARAHPFREVTRAALRALVAEALGAGEMRPAASWLRADLARFGGLRGAARHVEELASAGRRGADGYASSYR